MTDSEAFMTEDLDTGAVDAVDEDDFTAVIVRLNRDLRRAAEHLSEAEARYLVAAYYNLQELRIRCAAQQRKLGETGKPFGVIQWLGEQSRVLEDQIRAALDRYSANHRFGVWPRSVVGIGPCIAAGLIAHTHIEHLTTAGHLWSFAGLDPSKQWNRAEPRPWNAQLKVICWKAGQSFVKVQGHPQDIYGKLYKAQKQRYLERNEAGGFAANAEQALATRRWDKSKDAYKAYSQGKLPPAHIDAMARRWAVKLFLAHYWEICYELHYHRKPPLPYPVVHLGHVHIEPPRIVTEP
jgi:Transposase IS116/IS110/IS902 family